MRFGSLAWRGLAARPLRTALTVAGVALGVAIVTATLLANQAGSETVSRAAAELFGEAEIRVRAFRDEGFTPRAVTTLRSLPGVELAAPVAERRVQLTTDPGPDEQVFPLMLAYGVDPSVEAQIRAWPLESGRFLVSDRPHEVLVGAAWARGVGLEVGDRLRLTGRREGVPPFEIVGLLAPVGFGALDRGVVAVMPRETLASAFEEPGHAPVRYVDLAVSAGALPDVQRALDAELAEAFVVETVADARGQLERAQAAFAGLGFLFGAVALVVGAFLVFNALAMTVVERTRELGLLRAAGTTSRQVLGLFLRQGAAIGLLGAVAGLALGIGLAALMVAFLGSTRQVLVEGLPLSPPALLLAAAVGIGVAMAGSAVPAVQAARLSPIDALRPSRQPGRRLGARLRWLVAVELVVVVTALAAYPLERGDESVAPLLGALAVLLGGAIAAAFLLVPLSRLVGRPFEWFFGAEGMLGRANLGRDRARSGITVGALVMALAAVAALAAASETARAGGERWVSSIIPGGHAIRTGIGLPIEDFRPTFEAVPETRYASPIVELAAVVEEGERSREVSVAGIDPTVFQDSGALIVVEGRRAQAFQALRDGGAVLVPQGFADRHRVGVGDRLRLGDPGATPVELEVAGVVAYSLPGRGGSGALLISLADAREQFGATEASLWAMVPRPGVADSVYRSGVERAATQLAGVALSAGDLAGQLGQSLDRLVGLFDVLALIAVVIAALGIVNTLSMSVAERVREISVLRAHGMTAGQVQAMVVAEAAIMGAVGGVLAVVVGIGAGWAVAAAASAGGLDAGLRLPWAYLAAVVLLGIGAAALAGIYPARLAARQPIVRRGFE